MLDRPVHSIPSLLDLREVGHSLPAGLYTREDVFEADVEAIFHRLWTYVGLECDVPEPGDVNVVDIGHSSILILRDEDEGVRAFYNVCRHRGARLLPAGKGTVGKLVCPYHQWTYELTGELVDAPHMGRDFEMGCRDLKPVRLKSVAGLLFVCLADEPPADIDALAEAMEPRLSPYGLRDAKVAFETDLVEDGNWKLTMENNRECYHCSANHPELCVSFISLDFGFDPETLSEEDRKLAAEHEALYARRTAEWEAEGYPSAAIEPRPGQPTNFRTQRLIIANGGQSQTPDGRIACSKLMGGIERTDLGDLHFWTHHSWHHFMADHAVSISAIPLSAGKTLVRTKWLVHKDAVEGLDYDLENLTSVWKATNAEDAHLVGIAHGGVASRGYTPGPYSRFTETHLDDFSTWYVERLREAGY